MFGVYVTLLAELFISSMGLSLSQSIAEDHVLLTIS